MRTRHRYTCVRNVSLLADDVLEELQGVEVRFLSLEPHLFGQGVVAEVMNDGVEAHGLDHVLGEVAHVASQLRVQKPRASSSQVQVS